MKQNTKDTITIIVILIVCLFGDAIGEALLNFLN